MAEYRSVSHPFKRKKNGKPASCQEHIRVWILTNREIPKGHIIHHINGDKHDNRIENLKCMNRKNHALIHSKSIHLANNEEANKSQARQSPA